MASKKTSQLILQTALKAAKKRNKKPATIPFSKPLGTHRRRVIMQQMRDTLIKISVVNYGNIKIKYTPKAYAPFEVKKLTPHLVEIGFSGVDKEFHLEVSPRVYPHNFSAFKTEVQLNISICNILTHYAKILRK